MNKNIGKTDKTIRIVVGLLILLLGFVYKSWLGILGLVPVITAIVGVCPLYSILGKSTVGKDSCCCCGTKDNCCSSDHEHK